MTTPQKKTMKNEKKTPDTLNFNVTQTKTTSFELEYDHFLNEYMTSYPDEIETEDEFYARSKEIWNLVCEEADDDEIDLEEADCDDDVDNDYVDDASKDFVDSIIYEYNKTCPKYKAYKEFELKKQKEEEERWKKEQEVRRRENEERKKKEDEAYEKQRVDSIKHLEKRIAEMTKTLNELKME
jgi:hypothetical protein